MGIDQIGKKGPPLAAPKDEVGSPRRAETGRPFEVGAVRGTPAAPEATALESPRAALERLRAGEVDLKGYVDLKVQEATAHLAALPTPQLEAIRSALRDRMASDPTLVELVRTATGGTPEPPGGDA
jgi:uncharacterized protein (DUF2342 family)